MKFKEGRIPRQYRSRFWGRENLKPNISGATNLVDFDYIFGRFKFISTTGNIYAVI